MPSGGELQTSAGCLSPDITPAEQAQGCRACCGRRVLFPELEAEKVLFGFFICLGTRFKANAGL